MSEPSEIQQNITEAQYAATSGTGNATITITNGVVAPNTPTSFCLKNCVFTLPTLNK